jgi:hypothetical protein
MKIAAPSADSGQRPRTTDAVATIGTVVTLSA